jgi:hypothetical protein
LKAFDHLLVIGANRFLEADIEIAKEAKSYMIPVSFIRTKLDIEVDNATRKRENKGLAREVVALNLARIIREDTKKNLEDAGFKNPTIYILSALAYMDDSGDSMDEEKIISDILKAALRQRCKFLWV